MKTIVQEHSKNFQTLKAAFAAGDVALMECEIAATGEKVAVICAARQSDEGDVEFTPFASFFNGNPFEILNPPKPEGGFATQEEQTQG